jgi:hypothetical protein
MGQERFADVVERFTNGFGAAAAPASPETVKQWQEELDRNARRLANLGRLAAAPEPRTGQTPREEIYKRNKSRLYRYASSRRHGTPLLFVPNLGISRPYIFDLLPGGSFVEHMTREGFDFYLLDWAWSRSCPAWPARSWRRRAPGSSRSWATAWGRRCRPPSWPRTPRSP